MAVDFSTLLKQFPAFQQLDDKTRQQLQKQAQLHYLSAGSRLYYEGESCNRFLFVMQGSLRVQKLTDSGHEIVLYHIGPGETCRLTNTCLLGGHRYPAEAIAETEVELLSLPKHAFMDALEIFSSIDDAMTDLVKLVEEVAFGHLDHRLAQLLLTLSEGKSQLRTTHQELATELGTAREVVSRLLKEFERNGWLKLRRGSLEIVDRKELGNL